MSEIRTNLLKSERGDASPSAPFGLRVSGVCTATTFKGAVDASTGAFSSNVTISGNLGVAGTITYEDVARVDATGISTFREGFGVGPLAGIALTAYKDGSVRTSGIVTAASFHGDFVGDGSGLTGAGPTLANGSNDRLVTATGANALNGEANLTFNSSNILTATETGTGNGMGGISAATASAGGNAGYGFMTNSANRFALTTIGSAGAESLRIYDDNNNAERFRI